MSECKFEISPANLGKVIFSFDQDGRVTLGPDITLDEASKAFWEHIDKTAHRYSETASHRAKLKAAEEHTKAQNENLAKYETHIDGLRAKLRAAEERECALVRKLAAISTAALGYLREEPGDPDCRSPALNDVRRLEERAERYRVALESLLCNLTEGRQLAAEGLIDRGAWLDSMTATARAALSTPEEKP